MTALEHSSGSRSPRRWTEAQDREVRRSVSLKSDGAPVPEALRAGSILRIYPGRYWLADAIYAEARAEIDVTTFLRGRIVNPFSARHDSNDPSDPREDFKPAGGPCYRVLLGRPLRTEAERDINFILVPEELAHLWRDCELCCMAARILCPECKQVAYCSEYCQHKDWYKRHAVQCGQVIPPSMREDPNRFRNPGSRSSFPWITKTDHELKNDGRKKYRLLNNPNKQRDGKFTDEYIHNKLYPTNNGTWGHGREEPKAVTPSQWVIAHSPNWMLKVIACCIIQTGFDSDDEAELVAPMATSEHLQDVTAYITEQAARTDKQGEETEGPEQKEADTDTKTEKLDSPVVESVSPVSLREDSPKESPKTMWTSAFERETMWGNNPWGSDRLEMRRQKRRSQERAKDRQKDTTPKAVTPLSVREEGSSKSDSLLI